jgi:hypothetical protein
VERSYIETDDGLPLLLLQPEFIGFLVTNGIVLMKLSEKDQKEVKEKFGGKPFEMADQAGRLWVTPLNGPRDVKSVMPFVRKRYKDVSSTSTKT